MEHSRPWNIPGSGKYAGFTLIELMVVIAIIAVLASLGTGGYRLARRSAREAQAKAEIEQLRNALEEYRVEYGAYPAASAGSFGEWLRGLPDEPRQLVETAAGGLLRLEDPWGNPYQYESTNRFLYSIWSRGPDAESEDDDINPAQPGY